MTYLAYRTDACKFNLNKQKGDLFQSFKDITLVNCVTQEYHIGAGIAKEFRTLSPALGDLWHCKCQVFEAVVVVDGSRFIFNLINKL